MARSIHGWPGKRNGPASVHGLDSTHDPRQIFGDRQITARELLQGAYAVLSVVDRRDGCRARARPASEHRSGHSCCHPLIEHFSEDRRPSHSRREVSAGHTTKREKFLLRKSPASCRAARQGTAESWTLSFPGGTPGSTYR